MIKLNNDYSHICDSLNKSKEKMIELEEQDDKIAVAVCKNLYNYIARAVVASDDIYEFSLEENKFLGYIGIKGSEKTLEALPEHKKLVVNFLINSGYEFSQRKFIDNESILRKINISKKEELEIIRDYLKTTNKEFENLFDKFYENNRFFDISDSLSTTLSACGAAIYNPLLDDSLIFLAKSNDPILDMAKVMHELGHAYDWQTYRKDNSSISTSIYNSISSYSEVNSTYQQYRFYEYMLNNNIYKEATLESVKANIDNYFQNFLAISCFQKDNNYLIKDLLTDIRYSYGLMIGLSMLEDKNKYDSFQELRQIEFNKERLNDVGFSNHELSKVMIKKYNEYFGR